MKFNCLSVLCLSLVWCLTQERGIADDSLKVFTDTYREKDDIDDFIDLDDPFYHDSVLPPTNIQTADTKITVKSPTTTKPDVNIQVEDGFDVSDADVVGGDDDDVNEVSGAGSGSGSDGDTASNTLNITTLTATDNPAGIKLTPSTEKAEESTSAHQAEEKQEEGATNGPLLSQVFTSTNKTTDGDSALDDIEEEGAADNSILDFDIKEGGEDEEEDNHFAVTKSPPSTTKLPPTHTPEITRLLVHINEQEGDSDVFSDPGAGDGNPCDDVTCLYGAVCVTDGSNINCSCVFNCSVEPHYPVCGSNRILYPNSCEMRQMSCGMQKEITPVELNQCGIQTSTHSEMCPEQQAKAYWTNWSPWLASGDVDVRFRSCNIQGTSLGKIASCNGPRIEVKACSIREAGTCRLWNGTNTSKFEYQCDGIDIRDTPNSDMVFGAAANEGECSYSLFDLKRGKMVFSQFSLAQVISKGHIRKWCDKPDLFLVLNTPQLVCKRHLQEICKSTRKCKGSRMARKQRNLGDFAHKCWKDFIYGSRIPSGLSEIDSQYSFICQRFAKESNYGKVFGYKNAYFGTIFDTKNRIPVASLAKVSFLGDESWPQTPFMIERGLVENVLTYTWFYEKQRGMVAMSDISKCDHNWECALGMKQALPVDYEMSGYRTAHLVWPELVNGNVDTKLSTFALTNTAPMHTSLYTAWRHGIQQMRKYALTRCHVPTSRDILNRTNHPELYVVSGAVPSANPPETIGYDVNVPFLFWTAACCVRDGGHVESFAIYARNMINSPVIVAPILQLETLLQDIYKVKPRDLHLKIYPAGDGKCGELRNDVSRSIDL